MHKSKALVGIISCFLILSIMLICYHSEQGRASGEDIYVDDDQRYPTEADGSLYNPFYSIQDALNVAQDGDTIKILPGNYHGDLIVDKSVTITTEDIENTIVTSSAKKAYMIDITAESVSLEGLTIQDFTSTSHRKAVIHISSDAAGVTIIDCLIDYSKNGYVLNIDGPTDNIVVKNNIFNNTKGILIENSNMITLHGNLINNCSNNPALKLVSSEGNHIEENSFEDNKYGIYLLSSSFNTIFDNIITSNSYSGIMLSGGINNNILDNIIYNNDNYGIDLASSDGIISGNTIYNNYIGVCIDGSGNNIYDNIIHSCEYLGTYAKSGSRNNLIYNNTFKNKINLHALEKGINYWDNGIVGNYWSDFYGPDPSNLNNTVAYNNVVVPEVYKYTLGGVTDNYPKGIYQTQPEISDPSPANLAEGVDRSPILSVVVTDPDPDLYKDRLNVDFYYILDNSHNLIGATHNVESGSEASMAFSSTIKGKNAVYSYKGLGYGYIGVWYVVVEDSYSKITSPLWIFSTVDPPVNNSKPIAKIDVQEEYMVSDEIIAQINDLIQFDASGCVDSDGEIIFYRWSFGEGISVINEVSPVHSYKIEGTYNVNLAVIDDEGSSSTSNITVEIEGSANRAPSANINAPATGYVGDSIQFSSSGSSDPDTNDSIATYYWDFGGGATSNEENPTHQYSKAGKYTVTLVVTDQNGEEDTDNADVLIKTKQTEESPGYEIIFAIIVMLLVSVILRKEKNS